jgi:hypothetical protein
MWVALSALVSIACVLASARRLACAVAPIGLDAAMLVQGLQARRPTADELIGALGDPDRALSWERDLCAALATPDPAECQGLLSEQILELEWRAGRWARVPRVCASIATSAGLLCALMALMEGLSAEPLPDVGRAITPGVDALSCGIVGAAFCLAVHVRVRRAVREWLGAADRLVESLRVV